MQNLFDVIQGDVRFRESDHSYLHIPTGKPLTPVSDVIRTVYGIKSFDGSPGETPEQTHLRLQRIQSARVRGMEVDQLISGYLRGEEVTIDKASDVGKRVWIAYQLLEQSFTFMHIEPQKIVYSLDDETAGMLDFWIDHRIVVDLKCTAAVEKGWILQIGAYSTMAPSNVEEAYVLHVSPKLYPKGGELLEYNVESCKRYWSRAVSWWKDTRSMQA